MVMDACQQLGLRVPEDIAVIGVDNDPVACEFCHPPLSSISRNDREVGYQAARFLDQLIRGKVAPFPTLLIPPDGVVQRKSTEVMAVEDPEVAAVVKAIQSRLHQPFGVEGILGNASISRRRLEQRFRECLGSTPAVFLNEQRVERAKALLAGKDRITLTNIAAACGFTELRRFRQVFQRITGQSPAGYREKMLNWNASRH
jgi:LacI family transcriptional regulator